MPQMQTMSLHDKLDIRVKAIELEKQGKAEEAEKLHKSIPIPAYLARWAKKRFGAEALINTGFNLSEAEKEYGVDWLTK